MTVPRFFCGSFLLFVFHAYLVCLFLAALWSPAGKGLTASLSFFVIFSCVFDTFPCFPGSDVVFDCIDP